MAVGLEQIAEFMAAKMGEVGGDPDKVDGQFRKMLGEFGFDPDGVYNMGATIVALAVQMDQNPEEAMVGALVSGVVIGAALGTKP